MQQPLLNTHGIRKLTPKRTYAATLKAVRELQKKGILSKDLDNRTTKVLNNIIEQDHRLIKKRIPKSCGLQSTRTGKATLQGIEVLRALDKESRSDENHSDYFLWVQFDELFHVA